MKPDEHKKKKSAQYQQKHGGAKNDKGDTKQGKNDKIKGAKPVKDKKSNQPTKPKPTSSNITTDSSGSEEDDILAPGVTYEKKTFQKRKVVSNWARYELPDVEDNTTPSKGADFTELLSLTGNAVSQFRFKSEKKWDGDTDDTMLNQLISLDLVDLSSSLDCLPLYKRLALDHNLFTESQIQSMDEEAELCKRNYQSKQNLNNKTQIPLSLTEDEIVDSEDNIQELSKNVELNLSLIDKSEQKLIDTNTTENRTMSSATNSSVVDPSSSKNSNVPTATNTIVDPSSSKNSTVQSATNTIVDPLSSEQSNVLSICEQENELEQLLSLDKLTDESGLKEIGNMNNQNKDKIVDLQQATEPVPEAEPGIEDLEDWLDSVLDS